MDSRFIAAAVGVVTAGFFALRNRKTVSVEEKPSAVLVEQIPLISEPVISPPPAPPPVVEPVKMHRYIIIMRNYSYDINRLVGKELNVEPDVIERSEMFENAMLHFIRRLDPVSLSFLDEKSDVTTQASYHVTEHQVRFHYKQFPKEHVFALAKVLGNSIPDIQPVVMADTVKEKSFWLCMNKAAFLTHILACLPAGKMALKHHCTQQEPVYSTEYNRLEAPDEPAVLETKESEPERTMSLRR